MKIKRREYKRLMERIQTLTELEHTWLVIRTRSFENDQKPLPIHPLVNPARITTPELLRVPLVSYVQAHSISEYDGLTVAEPWLAGPIQFEFIKIWSGYEQYLVRKYTCPDESAEGATETRPATEPDSETVSDPGGTATSPKGEETITASGKTESADSPKGLAEHKNPPFPPYYSAAHDDIDFRENQSLTCVTLSQIEPFSGEEDIIHICDAPQFIAKLSAFQEFRSQLNKYKGQT